LDAIALKALAKEPAKRYQRGALAEDLPTLLRRKPIEALPARFTDRLHKLCGVISSWCVTQRAVAAIIAQLDLPRTGKRLKQATLRARGPGNGPIQRNQ